MTSLRLNPLFNSVKLSNVVVGAQTEQYNSDYGFIVT